MFTLLPAPYFKKYGKLHGVLAFVDGITAAAVGAITGSVIVIARRSIVDIPAALIALTAVPLSLRSQMADSAVLGVVATTRDL